MRSLLLAIFVAFSFAHTDFKQHCVETLAEGQKILENAAPRIVDEQVDISRAALRAALVPFEAVPDDDAGTSSSTAAGSTVTSGGSTGGPSTGAQTTAVPTDGTTTVPLDCPVPNNVTMFTPPPPKTTRRPSEKKEFDAPGLFLYDPEADPVAQYFSALHKYISAPNDVCDGPDFTDFNSITEHQLFGFFATLATRHPGPFCNLCYRFVDELRSRIFKINHIIHSPEEQKMLKLMHAFVPEPKLFCSAIAPACYETIEAAASNITAGMLCAECSGCMSITNVIQHRILLQPAAVEQLYEFLKETVFYNVCAELCILYRPINSTLFPNGFTFDGCQSYFEVNYNIIIEMAKKLTRPERFCVLELGWCELNEPPNMLHCLRELCEEHLGDTPQARWICSQIPDSPQKADEFLNVQKTKVYKKPKDYHYKYAKQEL